ncbi:MAG: hypothetical protein MUD12_07510 [Spirochaetes bacterium]|jgi:hypothetical protein|nr:hypothetical protein [Spirochaetota bacterium]
MKKTSIYISAAFFVLLFHAVSEAKSFIYFGDSRASILSMDPNWLIKAKTNWGQQIIKDGEIDYTGPTGYWNIPGTRSDQWVIPIALSPYNYNITVISLGGNDILQAYHSLEEIQNVIFWIRAVANPFNFLDYLFNGRWSMTPMDELFWLWHMHTVTDNASYNVNLISDNILNKNLNNNVIMNDIAPVLKPHVSGVLWDDWDLRAFIRINFYLTIFNYKLANYAFSKPIYNTPRVRFLWTSPAFWNNLLIYYLPDGVHFNSAGNSNWATLIALCCVNAGWLEPYPGAILPNPTDPTDDNPPVFTNPPSGSWSSGILVWLFQESSPITLKIHVSDDKGIAGIMGPDGNITLPENPSKTLEYDYQVSLPTNIGNAQRSVTIIVYDFNNNRKNLKIDYSTNVIGPVPLFNWWFYAVDTSYSSTTY